MIFIIIIHHIINIDYVLYHIKYSGDYLAILQYFNNGEYFYEGFVLKIAVVQPIYFKFDLSCSQNLFFYLFLLPIFYVIVLLVVL